MKKTPLRAGLLLALPCLALTADAAVLINLDATALPLGPLPTWANSGTIAGDFTASGLPEVTSVAGVKAVTLAGGTDFYAGPIAPAQVAGVNPNRSIEVWAFNPSVVGEETLVAWGRRGGPDGTNMSFNYGIDPSFGAVGQWGGGPDLGWNNAGGAPAAGVWHYLVYTYDGGGAAGAGTTRVYADGVLANSEFHGNLNTHDGLPFVLGGQNTDQGVPGGFNQGLSMARVRIHDVVLTPEQIAAKYAEEFPVIYPTAFLASSKIVSTSEVAFTIEDRPPTSVANPSSFTVTVGGIRAGWQVLGGEGLPNGSITSPALTVPNAGPVELTLKHRYNFEGDYTPANAYDGGVVQVSINGGEFTTLDNENFTQNGYYDSPIIGNGLLKGSLAFNGPSAGFASGTLITSIATIPGVASGNTIQVRFFGDWDEGFTPDGIDWEIAGVTVKAGAAEVLNQDFTGGDGGFTVEATAPGATWNFITGTQPTLGTLRASKSIGTTTLSQPIAWAPGRSYAFTIAGKDANGADLVYNTTLNTPVPLVLAAARTWPDSLPGPLGTTNAWGVRTYLNNGINNVETLDAAIEFLATADDRSPTLTPDTVVDTQEPNLNFVDPATNGSAGVAGCARPFPGEALSNSTNGGAARDDNYVVTTAHASIQITEEADYTFNFRGDDGFMFRIKAANGPDPKFIYTGGPGSVDEAAQNIIYFPTGTGDVNTRGIMHLLAGVYHIEYMTWEGGGGFWYQVSSAKGFFANNEDTTSWRPIGYTTTETAPLAYPAMAGDWTVLSTAPGAPIGGNLQGADAAVDAAVAADAAAATSLWPVINFQDPEGGGTSRIGGDSPWPRNVAADPDNGITGNDDNFAMRMSGTLRILEDGHYLIGYQGDDGSRLTIGGTHGGFTSLAENLTGAGEIGRASTIAANSGSLGAVVNFDAQTSAVFQRPGALAGSSDTAISTTLADGQKMRAPYNAALNPAGPFTAEIWLKPALVMDPAISSGLNCALSSGNLADPRSGWLIYQSVEGWNFRTYTGSGTATALSITAPVDIMADEWYHVVVSWDGTLGKVYVNGVLGATSEEVTTYVPGVDGRLQIGSRSDNAFGWSGAADELAIYGTALSDATILAHYENGINATRPTPYETLVQASAPLGYWRLNETVQPRADLGTIYTDVATGNSSTVGRIFLTAGDYPISSTFWEAGGGASYEIFAFPEVDGFCAPLQALRKGGWPGLEGATGLAVVSPNPVVPPTLVGGLTINPDGSLSISFQSVVGASYTLQSSTTLASWQNMQTVVATTTTTTITGTAGLSFYYNPADPDTFYRVRAN